MDCVLFDIDHLLCLRAGACLLIHQFDVRVTVLTLHVFKSLFCVKYTQVDTDITYMVVQFNAASLKESMLPASIDASDSELYQCHITDIDLH